MKKLILAAMLLVAVVPNAHAGVGDWAKNIYTYATSPVPCLLNLGKGILDEVVQFGVCFLSNANRNPATLNPIIDIQERSVTVE